jgi:excisionase family DNA binding protein
MPGTLEEDKDYLSRSEVAELFDVSPNTVTRWAEAGKLPFHRTLGGHRRYDAEAVLELARQMAGEENGMERRSFHIPNMYGDHHVLHVKQLLKQLDGVEDTLASAAFQEIDVTFDPDVVSDGDIEAALAGAGYPAGSRNGFSNVGLAEDSVPRHAKAFSEAMTRSDSSKWKLPAWRSTGAMPCPGFEFREVAGEHPADK